MRECCLRSGETLLRLRARPPWHVAMCRSSLRRPLPAPPGWRRVRGSRLPPYCMRPPPGCQKLGRRGAGAPSSREVSIPSDSAAPEHRGDRRESRFLVQLGNYQRLLMLVHPPAEGLFRWESGSLKGETWLPIRRGLHFMCLLVVNADTHDIEVHHRAQLSCENAEELF